MSSPLLRPATLFHPCLRPHFSPITLPTLHNWRTHIKLVHRIPTGRKRTCGTRSSSAQGGHGNSWEDRARVETDARLCSAAHIEPPTPVFGRVFQRSRSPTRSRWSSVFRVARAIGQIPQRGNQGVLWTGPFWTAEPTKTPARTAQCRHTSFLKIPKIQQESCNRFEKKQQKPRAFTNTGGPNRHLQCLPGLLAVVFPLQATCTLSTAGVVPMWVGGVVVVVLVGKVVWWYYWHTHIGREGGHGGRMDW